MNRRTQGRVKQARRRAQRRADIRAGRVLGMQEYLHRSAHQHQEPELVVLPEGTHELVNNETGQVLQRGTEYQMRKQRAISLEASPEGNFSVRKVKVVAA